MIVLLLIDCKIKYIHLHKYLTLNLFFSNNNIIQHLDFLE